MKAFRLLAALLLAFLLVGCYRLPPVNTQNTDPSNVTPTPSNLDSHNTSDATTPLDNTTQPTDNTTEPENLTTGKYTLYFDYYENIHNQVQPFKNGLAVNRILYDDNVTETKLYIGVINTKGEILYKLDTGLDQYLSNTWSTYRDGADFEMIGSGKDLVCFKYGDVYYLINSKGKELLNSSDGEIDRVLAVGDGNALVYKNVSSISSKEEKLGVIDSDGNWLLPLTTESIALDMFKEARYLGCGIYLWTWFYRTGGVGYNLFNFTDNVWSDNIDINTYECGDDYIGSFVEDEDGLWAFVLLDVELYHNPKNGLTLIHYTKDNGFSFTNISGYDVKKIVGDRFIYVEKTEDTGDIYKDEHHYCSYSLTKNSYYLYPDFEARGSLYYNNYGVTDIDYFGDIFVAHIAGMDEKNYIVILNEEMVAISEPRLGGKVSYENGKVFDGYELTDLQGNVINNSFPSEYYLDSFSDGITVGSDSVWSDAVTRYISETGEILFETLTDSKADHTHTWSSTWSYNEEAHWHACSECNEKSDYSLHNWTEWETHEPSADDETSSRERHCTVCGWFTVELGEITVGG